MPQNPLLYTDELPPFDSILAEHVVPATTAVFQDVRQKFSKIEQSLSTMSVVEWKHVMDPLDDLEKMIHRVWGPVSHLLSVKNSPDLRQAYEDVQPKLVELGLHLSQSAILFSAYEAMRGSPAVWNSLSPARRRILDQKILAARMAGVGLQGAAKLRFNAISQEMAQLKTQFSNNVLDATKAWAMDVNGAEDIDGIPRHVLELASQEWNRAHNSHESSQDRGPWRFTLDIPSYLPFMEYAKRRDLREKMYRARMIIASQSPHDNSETIDRILALRQELAEILGYRNYAEMSVAKKMAGSTAAVSKLLESLLSASREQGLLEHAALSDFAKSKGESHDLWEWDIPYWSRLLKEDQFDFSEDALKPYFPMPRVLEGLFKLVRKLFDVRVEAADGQAPVWHEDVRFFKVFDQVTRQHIASFYLDPYSRPHNKRGGAWMDDCVGRRFHDGKLDLPVAHLVCNGTPPVGAKASLMSFDEVRTLFHEFGHGLQHMLTKVDDRGVAGIEGVEWDAVELASQFMENWLYHRETLRGLSGHFETGEVIPDEFISKIIKARNFRSATAMLRQLQFALTDIELHSTFDPKTETPHELAQRVARRTSPLPPRPESRILCSFSHIFAGGYSAGYYSYKWAEVLSADAFAAFEEVGLENEQEVKKIGRRYRDTILALGGSEHPTEVFRRFRGRDPSPDALLRHSGLANLGQS